LVFDFLIFNTVIISQLKHVLFSSFGLVTIWLVLVS